MEEKKEETFYSDTKLIDDFTANRNVLLCGTITSKLATQIMIIMLKLEQIDPYAPINLYIDSPGGDVRAGLAIIDTMNSIKCPVNTFCYSLAASMAAVILAAGKERYAFEHSEIMIHQPLTPLEGVYKQTDLSARANSLEKSRKQLEELLTSFTKGKTEYNAMHAACEKDNYLTPDEALEMGLIDKVVKKEKQE